MRYGTGFLTSFRKEPQMSTREAKKIIEDIFTGGVETYKNTANESFTKYLEEEKELQSKEPYVTK